MKKIVLHLVLALMLATASLAPIPLPDLKPIRIAYQAPKKKRRDDILWFFE